MTGETALDALVQLAWTDPSVWKRQFPGRKVLGVFGPYVPWEPILACGYEPVFLFPENLKASSGKQQLLPPFACHVSRTLLDYAAGMKPGDMDALLFVQSCDAVQAVADIVSASSSGIPIHFFSLPRLFSGETAQQFYQAELAALTEKLGGMSEEKKKKAADTVSLTRKLLTRLYRCRQQFTALQFYSLLRAVHYLPKDFITIHLEELLSEHQGMADPSTPGKHPSEKPKTRLFLAGSHLPGRLTLEAMDEAGVQITGEMIDLGLAAMLQSPFQGEPVPGTWRDKNPRRSVFRQKVDESRAEGVIFYRQKYCDPHGFDIADLGDLCRTEKIPFLNLELDSQSDIGRISTRVEAFLEMLEQESGADRR